VCASVIALFWVSLYVLVSRCLRMHFHLLVRSEDAGRGFSETLARVYHTLPRRPWS
jgi:hypothetical protein